MIPDQFVVYLILLVVPSRIVAQLLLTTTSIIIPPTQTANPVASAGCHSPDIAPIPATFSTGNGSVTPNDLLDSLGSCSAITPAQSPPEYPQALLPLHKLGLPKSIAKYLLWLQAPQMFISIALFPNWRGAARILEFDTTYHQNVCTKPGETLLVEWVRTVFSMIFPCGIDHSIIYTVELTFNW